MNFYIYINNTQCNHKKEDNNINRVIKQILINILVNDLRLN